jgi:hypothetical protein
LLLGFDLPGRIPNFKLSARQASSFLCPPRPMAYGSEIVDEIVQHQRPEFGSAAVDGLPDQK